LKKDVEKDRISQEKIQEDIEKEKVNCSGTPEEC